MNSEFCKLLWAYLHGAHTVEIRERETEKNGVAMLDKTSDRIICNYGADDGSDDKTVTPEEFGRDFIVTSIIFA